MVRRRRVSIKDVADQAGVNRSTVSRALRADPRITPSTIAKVLEVSRRLGYVPHSGARALAMGKTHVITAIVPSLRLPFPYRVLCAIEEAVMRTPYRLRVEAAHAGLHGLGDDDAYGLPSLAQTLERVALGAEADGVILVAQGFPDAEIEQVYARHRFPVVLVEGKGRWGGRVSLDNVRAGRLATEHLLQRGRRKLALVSGNCANFQSYADRREGFLQVAAEQGLALPPVFESEGVDLGSMAPIAQSLFAQRDHLDGVVVSAGDPYALRLMEELSLRGLRIPADLAVVSFDDLPEAHSAGLSSIRQPFDAYGRQAVAMLVGMIDGQQAQEPRAWLAPPELAVRASA